MNKEQTSQKIPLNFSLPAAERAGFPANAELAGKEEELLVGYGVSFSCCHSGKLLSSVFYKLRRRKNPAKSDWHRSILAADKYSSRALVLWPLCACQPRQPTQEL